VRRFRPAIVAIDSPLGFPRGMCCLEDSCPCESVYDFKGRTAERELLRSGVRLYITTKKTFIKPMIYRAIRIAETLRTDGIEAIEVYPYAAKRALFGPDIPPKTTRAGIEFLRARLLLLVPDLGGSGERLTHDGCDALLAAHTAWLHSAGRTVSYGDADEVPIVAPVSA
jgi:predicted nuclease with RNAse H fold